MWRSGNSLNRESQSHSHKIQTDVDDAFVIAFPESLVLATEKNIYEFLFKRGNVSTKNNKASSKLNTLQATEAKHTKNFHIHTPPHNRHHHRHRRHIYFQWYKVEKNIKVTTKKNEKSFNIQLVFHQHCFFSSFVSFHVGWRRGKKKCFSSLASFENRIRSSSTQNMIFYFFFFIFAFVLRHRASVCERAKQSGWCWREEAKRRKEKLKSVRVWAANRRKSIEFWVAPMFESLAQGGNL